MRWLKSLWFARLRNIDRRILWPSCKRLASDMDTAKAAFAYHAFNDLAWLFLGEDRIYQEIEAME